MNELKVQPSKYKSELSFNEWVMKYNVSGGYVQPTKFYEGNPRNNVRPIGVARFIDETPFQRFVRVLLTKLKLY